MLVIFVAFAAVLAVVGVSKWYVPPEKVKWTDNFAAAQTAAREQNKPILLYFTAEWCGPCQWMRRNVWTEQSVADAMAAFVPVRIDADKEEALARQFQVQSFPLFFVIDPEDGKVLRILDHGADANEFTAWLKP